MKKLGVGGGCMSVVGGVLYYCVIPFWVDSPRLFGTWGIFCVVNAVMNRRRLKQAFVSSGLVLMGAPVLLLLFSCVWRVVCIAADPLSFTGATLWVFILIGSWAGRAKLRQAINQLRWSLNRHRFEADFRAAAALDLTNGRAPVVLTSPSEPPEITTATLQSILTCRASTVEETELAALQSDEAKPCRQDRAILTHKLKAVQRQLAHLHGKRVPQQVVQLSVNRNKLVENSLDALRRFPVKDLACNMLEVQFDHEYADDRGGVTRDWMDSLGRAISTNLLCDSNGRWSGLPQPVDCLADSEAGMELLAVGRLAALCVLHQCHAPLQLHSTVWQLLTSSSISLRQLWPDREGFYEGFIAKLLIAAEVNDPVAISEASKIVAADGDQLRFVCPDEGTELIPNGSQQIVTPANATEYVHTLAMRQLERCNTPEVSVLLGGFWELVPRDVMAAAGLQGWELAQLVQGDPRIDVDDWKAFSECSGFDDTSSQVMWFWELMRQSDNAFRTQILQFATGSGAVPVGGFGVLEPKFTIAKDPNPGHLPQAHVCANQLMLPECSTVDDLRNGLVLACKHGAGFGFV